MTEHLDYDWLRANHRTVHYFGLGFIQLKLDARTRMHFYTPELPPVVPDEDVHNHRYDFTSEVLKGVLEQHLYQVVAGDTHVRCQETCKAGVAAGVPPAPCGLEALCFQVLPAGSVYQIRHQAFHRVAAHEPTVTRLVRSEYRKELAEVVRPAGAEGVCPFSKPVPEAELWAIIRGMLA